MQWEYHTLILGVDSPGLFYGGGRFDQKEFDQEMNRLGRQGWELVVGFDTSKAQGGTQDVILVFKRLKVMTALPADK
jgi:hypothetical protein